MPCSVVLSRIISKYCALFIVARTDFVGFTLILVRAKKDEAVSRILLISCLELAIHIVSSIKASTEKLEFIFLVFCCVIYDEFRE